MSKIEELIKKYELVFDHSENMYKYNEKNSNYMGMKYYEADMDRIRGILEDLNILNEQIRESDERSERNEA